MPSRRSFLFSMPIVFPLVNCASAPPNATRRAGGLGDPLSAPVPPWPPDVLTSTQKSPATLPAPSDSERYACPMHPEVSQPKAGVCPICGMPLELKKAGGST